MEHAARLFAVQGYHTTSVQEVVASLGVGKGVFYWYFSSKEELFGEILKAAQTDLRRAQQAAIKDIDDPVRRIELGIRASLQWFHDHRHYLNLLQFAATQERFAPVLQEGRDVAVSDVVRHLKDGIVEGRVRDIDLVLQAQAILGVVLYLVQTYLVDGDEPLDELADTAVTFCLHGILA